MASSSARAIVRRGLAELITTEVGSGAVKVVCNLRYGHSGIDTLGAASEPQIIVGWLIRLGFLGRAGLDKNVIAYFDTMLLKASGAM